MQIADKNRSSQVMASHGSHSERAMADLAHQRLRSRASSSSDTADPSKLRALVGGLGAGHTLQAALALPGITQVDVIEISPKVVEWNRAWFAEVNGNAVDDDRVHVQIADLTEALSSCSSSWDLMLLDIDNGPGWLATPGNAGLYEDRGLESCRRALSPEGVLAIWSPGPSPRLRASLERVFSRPAAPASPAGQERSRACVEEITTSCIDEPPSTIYIAVAP